MKIRRIVALVALLAAALCPSSALATASLIQFASAFDGTTGASIAVTLTATSGSFFFLATSNIGPNPTPASTIASVSDGTNTWHLLNENDINGFRSRSAWASNSVSGSLTITVTYDNPASSNRNLGVEEIGGCSAFQVGHDQQQFGPGSGTDAVSSGNATPTSQPAFLVGGTWDVTGITQQPAAGTGFTLAGRAGNGTLNTMAFEYKRITSTSAVAATFTNPGGDTFWITHAAIFTETAGGGGGPVDVSGFFGQGLAMILPMSEPTSWSRLIWAAPAAPRLR